MTASLPPMRYLATADVVAALADLDVVAAVEDALRSHAAGAAIVPEEAYLGWRPAAGGAARTINMPGMLAGDPPRIGTKVINANTANPERGIARASGLVLLFDPDTAAIAWVMAAAPVSSARTAAVTAASARCLASAAASSLALIGAGPLAEAHAVLLVRTLPALKHVRLFDLDEGRAAGLARRLVDQHGLDGIEVAVAASAEDAVREASIVVPVTTTTEPYIGLDWLAPGTLLVNVSLDDAGADVLLGADRLFVDDWELVRADGRRLLGRLAAAGRVVGPHTPAYEVPEGARVVDAELGQVLAGVRPGRRHDDEVVVVNPFGLSIEDVAVASAVADTADALGLGVPLDR